mgnify:CR=1 FL=1|jgi:hypothetical protein
MKYLISFFVLLLSGTMVANAQYAFVNYDFEKNWFNQGDPLPAERYMMISGSTLGTADLIEVSIYRNMDKDALYVTEWLRAPGNMEQKFDVPVNFSLRGGSSYSITLDYFVPAGDNEREAVLQILEERFSTYIEQVVEIDDRHIRLRKSPKLIMKDLEIIMEEGLSQYRNRNGLAFSGFSSIIEQQVERLEDIKLRKAFLYVGKKPDESVNNAKYRMVEEQLSAIKSSVISEASQYVNGDLLVLSFSKSVLQYPTESTMNFLPINVGYMGVYEEGDLKNLSYGTAPSVGISFSLGNRAFSSPFWSNTSFSVGALLS